MIVEGITPKRAELTTLSRRIDRIKKEAKTRKVKVKIVVDVVHVLEYL